MRSQWKRLALAAGLSLSCAGGTLLWYYGTEKKFAGSGEAPLAQVSHVGDEVLRRPPTRLLWQAVNTGDNLYNGETLRTSNRGELRIQFEDGRYIDLEPDSLIVLQKSKGEISLDLMEGSLFVNAKAGDGAADTTAAPGLVLNSKNGKVDLTGASASLSKGSGGRLDVQVLEGKATIQGADGKEKELSSGKSSSIGANGIQFDHSNVTVLSPAPNKPYFMNPDDEKPVRFRWRGYPPAWTVSVMAGPTRKDLREIASTAKPGDTEVATTLPLGKHWWRFVAKDPATGKVMAESPVSRVDLQARYAPTVVFPLADAEIPVERGPYNMTFKWGKPEDSARVQLEVADNPSMKSPLLNRAFSGEDQTSLPGLKDGTYYWRMSAYYDGAEKPLVGKVQKFTLQKIAAIKKDPVQIVWTVPENKLVQNFVSTPQLEFSWEAKNRAEDIAGYRLSVVDENTPGAEPFRMNAREPKARAAVPAAGRYIASVEALDKDGAVIGRSDAVKLAATELPLLAPPNLLPAEGVLHSGADGRTELKWENVQGAKEYMLTVLNKDGKQLARKKYDGNSANLKNLMPGEYTVTVEAVDDHGRASPQGPKRTLVVPDNSGLKAPTLKKIKVN